MLDRKEHYGTSGVLENYTTHSYDNGRQTDTGMSLYGKQPVNQLYTASFYRRIEYPFSDFLPAPAKP